MRRTVTTTIATNNGACLSVALMYDSRGEITTDPTACYMVDAEGEISRIVEPGEVITTRVLVMAEGNPGHGC